MEHGSKYQAKQGKKKELEKAVRERCSGCRFKIRGENHNEGSHHKSGGKRQ